MVNRKVQSALRIVAVCTLIALVTALYRVIGLMNVTTVALTLLLVVLGAATLWGLAESLIASVMATLCFNYFFLPPVNSWHIADPQNWIALFSFLTVSVVASQLSERARREAREALQHEEEKARLTVLARENEIMRNNEQFKTTLLDALAHELKTPLTSVKASISALRAKGVMEIPKEDELLAIIEEETDRLNGLVTELLQMARVEAGKLRLNREPCRVSDFVNASVEESAKLLEGRAVNVEVQADLPFVAADRPLIQTVLRHLLDNAAKYSPSAQPIHIRAARKDGQVLISVRDHGPGIDEAELSRVFERYYRARDTAKLAPGTGIGLSVARDIIVAHHGQIWAESQPGGGTLFTFSLPLNGDQP